MAENFEFKKYHPLPGAENALSTRTQEAPRSMFLNPTINTKQQNFVQFSTAAFVAGPSYIWHNINPRMRRMTNGRPLLFVGPMVLLSLIPAQNISTMVSRRAWQCCDRYDRNWRDMPLDW
eukprot:UN00620